MPSAVVLAVLLPTITVPAESAGRIADARIVTADSRCLAPASSVAVVPCSTPASSLDVWDLPPIGFLGDVAATGRCFEASGDIRLAACTGEVQQQFRRVHDGRILDAEGSCLRSSQGDGLVLHPCDGSEVERFRVQATNRWTEIHGFPADTTPESSNVLGDAIEVGADGVVYALIAGGGFRSVDRGETWGRLPGLAIDAASLVADPFDPRRLVLQQGVGQWFVTRDGALSWQPLFYPGGARQALAVDPTTPGRWMLSGREPAMPLLESGDAGRTWLPIPGPPVGLAFRKRAALHPTTSDVLAVAVFGIRDDRKEEEEGVWITVDRGATWKRTLAGEYDHALFAADANASLYVWGEDGLYRTRDLGRQWTPLAAAGPLVVDPGDPNRLWSLSAYSPDGGATWKIFDDSQRFKFDLAIDPSDPDAVYTIGETVARSVDRAASFTRVANGLPLEVRFLTTGAGDTTWALINGQPWRSRNGGVTWKALAPASHASSYTLLLMAPLSPDTVYVADSFLDPGLFVSHDAGASWTELSPGVPVEHLRISRASAKRLVAFDGRLVSRSLDGGDTWSPIDVPFDVEDAAWDPHDADVAYLVNSDSISPLQGVLRSTDGGGRFERVFERRFLAGVAVDPRAPGRLYAFDHVDLWRSDDRGETWSAPAPLPGNLGVRAMVASAATDDALFLASRIAVHRSLDAGRGWSTLLELPGIDTNTPPLTGFAVNDDDTLWVSSQGRHFLRGRFDEGAPLLLGTDRRFAVEVSWRDFRGRSGAGRAVDRTGDTGYFWFFRPGNVELMVKVLDGRPVNGRYWVFYGALSNVEYEITVRDRFTGAVRRYRNSLGHFASVGDTDAFPADGMSIPTPAGTGPASGVRAALESTSLPLRAGRFTVEVSWRDFRGRTGAGTAAPITDDSGAFWFFNANNEELVVKVLDGRPLNGRFWVFYGALSNVEYEIVVTDTQTGEVRRYHNPLGNFGSRGDTAAF